LQQTDGLMRCINPEEALGREQSLKPANFKTLMKELRLVARQEEQ
jgi:hypothetical protein